MAKFFSKSKYKIKMILNGELQHLDPTYGGDSRKGKQKLSFRIYKKYLFWKIAENIEESTYHRVLF